MGTLANILRKLTYLETTKEQIRQAIESKGVSVPTSTKFADYPGKIDQIPLYADAQSDFAIYPKDYPDGHTYSFPTGAKKVHVVGDPNLSDYNQAFARLHGTKIGTSSLSGQWWPYPYRTFRADLQAEGEKILDKYRDIIVTKGKCIHLVITYYNGALYYYFRKNTSRVSGATTSYSFYNSTSWFSLTDVYRVVWPMLPGAKARMTDSITPFIDESTYNCPDIEVGNIIYSNTPLYFIHKQIWPNDPTLTFTSIERCPLL